ncbi:MAG TPA: response regulator [Pyrinomonadaceae bacterium]|jgi:DNA-binding response OmpR family regulator
MTDNTLAPKKQILCADGHEDTCLLVSYLLKSFGYEVTAVNDMSNGLSFARTADYDLYLIADKLTEGTGIEFCEKLREIDPQTPILFWSARVYESDRKGALEAGANVFLRKPCDYDAIPAIIFQLIDESQQFQLTRSSRKWPLEKRSPDALSLFKPCVRDLLNSRSQSTELATEAQHSQSPKLNPTVEKARCNNGT